MNALAIKNVSNLAAEAAKAQTAALIKLKPAGIKLTCTKFDGEKTIISIHIDILNLLL